MTLNDAYRVDDIACEGCASCFYQCPVEAIFMEEQTAGRWFRSDTRFGPLFYRWMYYATGLPGWVRFGFSPGWLGYSPAGLGPAAEYLMTGQWPTPQMAAAWGAGPWAYGTPVPGALAREQELQMLRDHAEALKVQLDQISARIEELEGEA